MKTPEFLTIGRYPSDPSQQPQPISWRVLSKGNGVALLISERILDYLPFSSNGKNDWESSDLRKWLNEEFLLNAFSEEEREHLIPFEEGESVSLLGFNDYFDFKLFPNYKALKAEYTEFARKRIESVNGFPTKDAFGFWWLKTPNKEGPFPNSCNPNFHPDENTYVFHVCNTGKLNGFKIASSADGVRPLIRIKL